MKILVGTSGFNYKDWIGPFYPEKTNPKNMLNYYAEHFCATEINATYYRLPDAKMFENMAQRTPDNFRFSVKANQQMTHKIEANFPEICKKFLHAVIPLKEADKFLGVLFQFPYSFKNIPKHNKLLKRLREFIPDDPIFIEFRNREWFYDETFNLLQHHQLSYVSVDEPDFSSLMPSIAKYTSNLGYIRFHGRNKTNWWKGTNATRYNYKYSYEELTHWGDIIQKTYKNCDELYIFFNNHPYGNAVANAQELMGFLNIKKELSKNSPSFLL